MKWLQSIWWQSMCRRLSACSNTNWFMTRVHCHHQTKNTLLLTIIPWKMEKNQNNSIEKDYINNNWMCQWMLASLPLYMILKASHSVVLNARVLYCPLERSFVIYVLMYKILYFRENCCSTEIKWYHLFHLFFCL